MLYALTYEVAQFYVPPAPKPDPTIKVQGQTVTVAVDVTSGRTTMIGGTREAMAHSRDTSGWRKSERSWKAHRHDQFGCGRL